MKRKSLWSLFALIAAFSVLTFAPAAQAAAYPEPGKVIDFGLHSKPGSGMDAFQRMVARFLNDEGIVKPKIQVFNRQGGATATRRQEGKA